MSSSTQPSTPRPYGSYFDEIADALGTRLEADGSGFGEAVERVVVDRGELTLHVRREHLLAVVQVLRAHVDDHLLGVRPVPGLLRGPDDLVPVLAGDVVDPALGHVYDLRSSGGGTVAPRYSTGMPPSG